jgi:LmeA-like phospholipid-binding
MSTTVVEVPRRKHRGRNALVILLVVVLVLVAAFFVGDYFARKYATNYVRQQVATALDLPSTAPVSVNLGSGSLLLQAATGALNNVTISVNPLVLDGLSGSAALSANGVPLNSTTAVSAISARVFVPATTLTKAISQIPSLAQYQPQATIVGGHVVVAASGSILGFVQHIAITLVPQVSAGEPSLLIQSAKFNGVTVSVTRLEQYIPGLSELLHSATSLCIANSLPAAFVLTGISIRGQSLVSTFTGNGVELNGASLSRRGTCPAS